jgi:hypothetical protein
VRSCRPASKSWPRTAKASIPYLHSLKETATDGIIKYGSAELVDCNSLAPGSQIEVETKSRHYQIEWLGGNAIRISGHPAYCPNPVPARLHGSLDKEGVLESV